MIKEILAKQLADAPIFILTPIIFNCIFFWMVGLNSEGERFIISCGILVILMQCILSFGKDQRYLSKA